jgi:predicted transcriptional regulator
VTDTLSVRLDPAEHEALRRVASVYGTSMNSIIRQAVRAYLSVEARRAEVERLSREADDRYAEAFRRLAEL